MKLNKKQIILITALITIALIGLIVIQVQLLKDSYEQKQKIFSSNVMTALQQTAEMFETEEAVTALVGLAPTLHDTTIKAIGKNNFSYVYTTGGRKQDGGYNTDSVIIKKQVRVDDSVTVSSYVISSTDDSSSIPPLDENMILGKSTGRTPQHFKYYFKSETDSSGNSVPEIKIEMTADNLRKLDSSSKKTIVANVVDRLILWQLKKPDERINKKTLDSLLDINLKNAGIELDYKFGVITKFHDSSSVIIVRGNEKEIHASTFKSLLFPTETFLPVKYFLSIYFEDTDMFLYKQILPQLLLSFLFMIIIISGFVFTVRTIVLQKKLGSYIIDFINNMTHEFKTPLSTIALATEAMSKPEVLADEDKLTRYNKIITDENTRMRKQVEKILQMAVLEEGDYELHLSDVDVHTILLNLVDNFNLQLESGKGMIDLSLNAAASLITGDIVHVTGILNNIIDNAVKYSPDCPDIFISTKNVNESISIKISDKGIGISHDDIKKIFDKYYRVPTGNLHDIKGFGLGLSYVKLMVEAHKGEIKVESIPGEGTTIEIILPLIK